MSFRAAFSTLVLSICSWASLAQPVLVSEYTYGSTTFDFGGALTGTADGGFAFVTDVSAADGDVTSISGGKDLWLVKCNASGSIQWQKTFGGSADEDGEFIMELPNGDFVVGGFTDSNDGDVVGNHGGEDMWVLRVSNTGVLLDQACLGGTAGDVAFNGISTADNGFFLVGYTFSDDGQVSGFHGNGSNSDAWVAKIDADFELQWQRSLGGGQGEVAYGAVQLPTGGFAIAASARSSNGDVSANNGAADAWFVELSASGQLVQEANFGGSSEDAAYDIVRTASGNFVLCGISGSDDGDLPGHYGSIGFPPDSWVWSINANAQILWSKNLGGTGTDTGNSITQNAAGFLVSGETDSDDNDVPGTQGQRDYLLTQLDANGNLVWVSTFGGPTSDNSFVNTYLADGRMVLFGNISGSGGDITEHIGGNDLWVVVTDLQVGVNAQEDATALFSLRYDGPRAAWLQLQEHWKSAPIELIDANGRVLRTYAPTTNGVLHLQAGDLPAGAYLVRVRAADARHAVRWVVGG
jgi:hypothetical protein